METIGSRHGQDTLTGFIGNDPEWHYFVDNICLDTKGKVALLLNAMHDINK
jgi:hypothetical protein